jgi:hypothetical protein
VGQGTPEPVYLLHGDLVMAGPAGERLGEALAEAAGCRLETYRRPAGLGAVLADLRTFSLFDSAKVTLAVDTAVLADRRAAADLVDAAAGVLPLSASPSAEGELAPREREAASRLLQALRLFDLDPEHQDSKAVLEQLPVWVLQGGVEFRRRRQGRGRGKRQVEDLRNELGALLEAARGAGLTGKGGGGDLAELAVVLSEGLPARHSLVLVERLVAADHPLVQALAQRGAVVALGRVEEERGGGWQGLDLLAEELTRQTGVGITPDALSELARRTLRQGKDRQRSDSGADADSTARLAGEYRKLANLAAAGGSRRIDRKLVDEAVEDRGEEDVWRLLDAVGAGRGSEALERLRRLFAGAEDPLAVRLTFFALFADFCRQLAAVRGMMHVAGVPPGERSYPRFKSRLAPKLQGKLAGKPGPLAGLHPFRLHRAYLAASRIDERAAARLPAWVLETEMRLKGDSGEPEAALAHLVARVSGLAGGGGRSASRASR